ncbi:hypothetical protein PUN28_013944 [Cardiocondyla obscurior]|uniref:Uncharacterized protein n=1 Tax=Cardiocondyla obscurior TaxID=286306 RepID=A0AAW2F6I0_9HYME
MAEKRKNYFEILQRSVVRQLTKMHTGLFRAFYFYQQPRYSQKTKKKFWKFGNIHCAQLKIDAYGPQTRYGRETKKNIFENWQHNIVRK